MPAVYNALFDAMQQLTEEAKNNFLAMDQGWFLFRLKVSQIYIKVFDT